MMFRFELVLLFLVGILDNANALYDDTQYIKQISTPDDVDSMVLQNDSIWMIQLYNPNQKESKDVADMYEALGILMRGIFSIGVVDVSANDSTKIIEKLSIKPSSISIPSFYLIGDNREKPIRVKGKGTGILDIQTMGESLMRHTSEQITDRSQKVQLFKGQAKKPSQGPSKVIQITESNFNEMVYENPNVIAIAFTAPWCGHCKKLLPDWEEAAVQLDGSGAQLGWIDATVEKTLAQRFNVNGYPTIKVFPGGDKNKKSSNPPDDYQSDRAASSIVRYMLQVVDTTGITPPISEMINEQTLVSTCSGHNQICVIAALPHLLDSGAIGRKRYRDEIVGQVAKAFRGTAYKFLWYEYNSQPIFENTLELTFGSPAVVAVSVERKAYALYRGSFSVKGITGFLHTITNGRTKVIPLPNEIVPKIESVIAWDGQDGKAIEEEMSLEDIMGDDEL